MANLEARAALAIARLACASATVAALACALPVAAAFGETLPDGEGEASVSVLTDVLPTLDPEARTSDVTVHVSDDAGQHVEGAQVAVAIVPPNAGGSTFDETARARATAADEQAPHASTAQGATSSDGRLVVQKAAVGATYRVSVSSDGHGSFAGEFACAGTEGETWEVALARTSVPPAGSADAPAQQVVRPLPSRAPWQLAPTGDAVAPVPAALVAAVAGATLAAVLAAAARKRRKGSGNA